MISSVGRDVSKPRLTVISGTRTAPMGMMRASLCLSDAIFSRSFVLNIIAVEMRNRITSARTLVRLSTLMNVAP